MMIMRLIMNNNRLYTKSEYYRELYESKDEHGPEAAEVGVGEESAEEGEEEDGADEVGHDVGRLRQREVHLPEHVRDQVVPHRRNRHHLKRLDPCIISHPSMATRRRHASCMRACSSTNQTIKNKSTACRSIDL